MHLEENIDKASSRRFAHLIFYSLLVLAFNAACSAPPPVVKAGLLPEEPQPSSDTRNGQDDASSAASPHSGESEDSSKTQEGWLSECLSSNGGSRPVDADCYSRYQESLESTQRELLREIRVALSKPGPEGTDYIVATALLETSQKNWKSYVDADCEIVPKLFGNGNAQGLAGGECISGHYEERNENLQELKHSYLEN